MILKQIIKYENAPCLEATWVRYDQLPDVDVPASPALYDADGKEVTAAVEAHTVSGEVIETVLRCHAYSNAQMDMLRADLGDDAAEHEALIAEVEATYVPPEPEPPYVPSVVSMRQARLALLGAGFYDDINAAIAGLPSPQKEAARIEWEYATEVQRSSGLVPMMGAALSLTEAQLDSLFITASTL